MISSQIPTTIITGFLGAGKTSAILQLLSQKPKNEKWAVLVNEFGEIGVDGSLFEGQYAEEQGVAVMEVPGGCMCCAAGLRMHMSLTILLNRKPDRLFIEPTGLGHPVEVLETLTGDIYREKVKVEKIITLVDARQLSDPLYTGNETFNQQIEIADIVVGNKSDLYGDSDRETLAAYVKDHGASYAMCIEAQQGCIDVALLSGATQSAVVSDAHHHHHKKPKPIVSELPLPESGFMKVENSGEGFQSIGWRFSPSKMFDRDQLFSFFTGISVERMKAVFITSEGIRGYNLTKDALTEISLDDCIESRVEIIAADIDTSWEAQLMDCLVAKA